MPLDPRQGPDRVQSWPALLSGRAACAKGRRREEQCKTLALERRGPAGAGECRGPLGGQQRPDLAG